MALIRQQDFIDSIEDSLQFISYYHPLDYVKAVEKAYNMEKSEAAKDAMAQILINSRMSAEGKRPLCQDTGIVTCFVKIGMAVQWDKTDMTVQEMHTAFNLGLQRIAANAYDTFLNEEIDFFLNRHHS